jgi:dTDP-4-dehydrorhamnose reductase
LYFVQVVKSNQKRFSSVTFLFMGSTGIHQASNHQTSNLISEDFSISVYSTRQFDFGLIMAMRRTSILYCLLSLIAISDAWIPTVPSTGTRLDVPMEQSHSATTRRDVLQQGLLQSLATGIVLVSDTKDAVADGQDKPVVAVLGANGKTGMEVVYALIQNNMTPISMTRSGNNPFERNRKLSEEIKAKIVHYPNPVDVVSIESLRDAFTTVRPSGIIFCASSSPAGGLPSQVDNLGAQNAAQLAKEMNARLVLISALAVDRPESQSFQITNTLGGRLNGIMDAKLAGENSVRQTLKDYIIVRPGVLMNGVSRNGASDIEINQGDYIGGGISRDELAAISVAALQSKKQGVTIEAYRTNTRTKLQKEFNEFSGKEQHGNTYAELFQSVTSD